MDPHKHQNQNRLVIYRKRMGFSQKQVAGLLGFRGTSMLSRYEHGRSVPPLRMAFCLSIVLRVPVEFLFPALYDRLRIRIRADEERLNRPIQQTLFSGLPITEPCHAKHP